jgi:hypothetical protein
MGATAMVYDHRNATPSGHFAGWHDRQTVMSAVHDTKCLLTLEKESDTFFAQTAIGITGGNVAAVASENLPDISSPTAVVTNSGALFVKDALVHISLSTLSRGDAGKVATGPSLISAARRTQRVP